MTPVSHRSAGGVRGVLLALVAVAAVVVPSPAASAHPLGNFTVNVYSGLLVQPDRVLIDLVVDMAEIPTFQARKDIDTNGDGTLSDGESSDYARRACPEAARRVELKVDGHSRPVQTEDAGVVFPSGAAGLPTLRLSCSLVTATGPDRGEREMVFRNHNYEDRAGWREIVAAGDRTTLVASDVPADSLSHRLTQYPQDLLQSPLDQRSATLRARDGGEAAIVAVEGPARPATAGARGLDRFSRSFTALVARQRLTLPFGVLAIVVAVALGAVHAVAPGHGKTMMAAYLVGQEGSIRQAGLIGATMTVTHTAGVLVLGVVLSASTSLAPETLYPWLGLFSGVLLAAIGTTMLYRSAGLGTRPTTTGHDHAHELVGAASRSGHHTHPHAHAMGSASRDAGSVRIDSPLGWQGLVAMGLVGGLLPSPSAVVVLLGAIALGRAWFGVALVVAYGVGMAGLLVGTGLVLVRAKAGIDARLSGARPGAFVFLAKVLPPATASVLVVAGLFFAVQGALRI